MRGLSKLGNNWHACKGMSRDLMRASMQNISVPKNIYGDYSNHLAHIKKLLHLWSIQFFCHLKLLHGCCAMASLA